MSTASARAQSGIVGTVTVEGDQTRAVRLSLDPARLARLGLSLEDVRRIVSKTDAAS